MQTDFKNQLGFQSKSGIAFLTRVPTPFCSTRLNDSNSSMVSQGPVQKEDCNGEEGIDRGILSDLSILISLTISEIHASKLRPSIRDGHSLFLPSLFLPS